MEVENYGFMLDQDELEALSRNIERSTGFVLAVTDHQDEFVEYFRSKYPSSVIYDLPTCRKKTDLIPEIEDIIKDKRNTGKEILFIGLDVGETEYDNPSGILRTDREKEIANINMLGCSFPESARENNVRCILAISRGMDKWIEVHAGDFRSRMLGFELDPEV